MRRRVRLVSAERERHGAHEGGRVELALLRAARLLHTTHGGVPLRRRAVRTLPRTALPLRTVLLRALGAVPHVPLLQATLLARRAQIPKHDAAGATPHAHVHGDGIPLVGAVVLLELFEQVGRDRADRRWWQRHAPIHPLVPLEDALPLDRLGHDDTRKLHVWELVEHAKLHAVLVRRQPVEPPPRIAGALLQRRLAILLLLVQAVLALDGGQSVLIDHLPTVLHVADGWEGIHVDLRAHRNIPVGRVSNGWSGAGGGAPGWLAPSRRANLMNLMPSCTKGCGAITSSSAAWYGCWDGGGAGWRRGCARAKREGGTSTPRRTTRQGGTGAQTHHF